MQGDGLLKLVNAFTTDVWRWLCLSKFLHLPLPFFLGFEDVKYLLLGCMTAALSLLIDDDFEEMLNVVLEICL